MIFDQHVHSNFSFDSNEDLENYINVCNENDIITTEHLDLENPIINYKDSLIDYLKYIEQIKDLNKKYSNKFFSGIEIGYTQKSEKRIEDFLKNKNFVIILLQLQRRNTRLRYAELSCSSRILRTCVELLRITKKENKYETRSQN